MRTRRRFLSDIGLGAAGAGLASAAAVHLLGGRSACAAGELDFGELEPLVSLMQDLDANRLLEALVPRIQSGERLETLIAAGALANARTFGGEDYTGYHAFMALMPAWRMATLLSDRERPLPVLKVVHRSTNRIREFGGKRSEKLGAAPPAAPAPTDRASATSKLLAQVRDEELGHAEQSFATIAALGVDPAFAAVQPLVRDEMDVHRVVLAWRAFETLSLVGTDYSSTLLRQVVHFAVDRESNVRGNGDTKVRTVVPETLSRHGLLDSELGTRRASDAEIERLREAINKESQADAADATAKALADGMHPDDVGEALALAGNHLLLSDPGVWRNPTDEKPLGSVHGASTGVHASDAASAWRNIARVSPGCAAASLVAGAYHTAGQGYSASKAPFSYQEQLEALGEQSPADRLAAIDAAVDAIDQKSACANAHRYLQDGHEPRALVDRLLRFAVADDGALHAEKYFATATEEAARARPAFRDRHLVGLARVATSQHVRQDPSVALARSLFVV